METIKFCKKCDTVIFIPKNQEFAICPKCGEVFINPSSDEDDINKEK